MQRFQFKKQYERDEEDDAGIDFTGDPGKTIQEPAEDCDINVLMRRMGVTDFSVIPKWENPHALYEVDLSDLPSDPTVLHNIMRTGELKFMTLPASIRGRFNNDPAELYRFMTDEQNKEECIKMGLLAEPKKEKPRDPIEVRVVPEPKTA